MFRKALGFLRQSLVGIFLLKVPGVVRGRGGNIRSPGHQVNIFLYYVS